MKKLFLIGLFLFSLIKIGDIKAESTIYVMDNYPFQRMESLTFNGESINFGERPFYKEKVGLKEYKKGLTKYTIKNDGRLVIVRDMVWAAKPYHDEMTLDLNDGDVYYLELVAGPKSKLKLLKDKDGEKKVQKIQNQDDWVIFPDYVFDF